MFGIDVVDTLDRARAEIRKLEESYWSVFDALDRANEEIEQLKAKIETLHLIEIEAAEREGE